MAKKRERKECCNHNDVQPSNGKAVKKINTKKLKEKAVKKNVAITKDDDVEPKNGKAVKKLNKKLKEKVEVEMLQKKNVAITEDDDDLEFWSLYPLLCCSIEAEATKYLVANQAKKFVKMIIDEFGQKKAEKLEEEWEELTQMEFEMNFDKRQLINTQNAAVLEKWNTID